MKYCKDCKHLSWVGNFCESKEINGVSDVTGEALVIFAHSSRMIDAEGFCGPEAKGFKRRDDLWYRIKNLMLK